MKGTAMSELFAQPHNSKPTTLCANCQEPFEPRTGSGGKAQKFCAEQCRRQFHGLKTPTPPTPGVGADLEATQTTAEQTRTSAHPKPAAAQTYQPDWEWWGQNKQNIVLNEQPETAVYRNTDGDFVLRQRARWDENDDPYLIIGEKNIFDFIDKLCDIAGIGSAGRRS
jgi:hypothetical protein